MLKANESGAAASELWRHTLSAIDTAFGRLVYLSSLRNPNSGRYEHFGLTRSFGSNETDRAMREAHRRTFSEWLCLTLRGQLSDLDDYLGSLAVDTRLVLRAWECQAAHHSLIPPDVGDAERQLYLCDFEMIVAVMIARMLVLDRRSCQLDAASAEASHAVRPTRPSDAHC